MFANCALNGLLVEHAPHSVYVAESWNGSGTLYDLSGNGRHAYLTVVPSPSRQRIGYPVRCRMLAICSTVPRGYRTRVHCKSLRGPNTTLPRNPTPTCRPTLPSPGTADAPGS